MTHHRVRTNIKFTNQFEDDVNRCLSRSEMKRDDFKEVMSEIQGCENVPDQRLPHTLDGQYNDCWECHIKGDWVVIWKFVDEETIHYIRTGTHNRLFQ